MEAGEEIACGLLVARCDRSKVFDDIEETLYEVAFAIECEVAIAFDAAIRFGRDHHLDRTRRQAVDEVIGVISLVGQQGLRLDKGQERFGLCDIVNLPTGEAERQRIA